MTRTLAIFALASAAALAACNGEDHTIVAGSNDQPEANQSANANVKLPPAIVASHKYRCKDNSLIAIDWLSDGTQNSARVTPDGGEAVSLVQAEAGGPYTAEGASLTGEPSAPTVTYGGKSCRR